MQPLFGVYLGADVTKNLDFRAEFESTRVKLANIEGGEGTVRIFSAGVVYRF